MPVRLDVLTAGIKWNVKNRTVMPTNQLINELIKFLNIQDGFVHICGVCGSKDVELTQDEDYSEYGGRIKEECLSCGNFEIINL